MRTWYFPIGLALLSGCWGSRAPELPPPPARAPTATAPTSAAAPSIKPQVPFATVPDGTYGPYLGQSGTARVAVWASHEGEQRAWFSVPIAEDGKPMGAFRRLVAAPEEIGLVLVTPSVGDSSADPGFLLLSTWADRTGTRVESLRLTPGGGALSAPVPLSTTPGPVLWIDSVPTGRGSLVFWASRSGTRARVSVVALDERGVPSSAVRQLATSALAILRRCSLCLRS